MYDFDEYDDTGIQEQETVHDSSQTPFSEEGLARKRKALMHDFASGSQARDKAAVQREGKELSLEGVMELLNSQTSGQVSAGKVSAEASGQVSADASPDSDSEKQSSSEEEQPSSFCGPLGIENWCKRINNEATSQRQSKECCQWQAPTSCLWFDMFQFIFQIL